MEKSSKKISELKSSFIEQLEESIKVKELLKAQADSFAQVAHLALRTLRKGGKVIFFGNGGSAADAQHLAAEMVGKFSRVRRPLPALALTTNTSSLTAISNDFSFDNVFSRQLEALAQKDDLVIGISTSGRSRNVLRAIRLARRKGIKTVGMTGGDGGELAKISDLSILVPSSNTQHIQECHITIGHALCGVIETQLGRSGV